MVFNKVYSSLNLKEEQTINNPNKTTYAYRICMRMHSYRIHISESKDMGRNVMYVLYLTLTDHLFILRY